MRDAARPFAAAGHAAMPVFHQAVADFDMLAGRFVALPHVQLARFECNAIIPQGEMRAREQDAIAAFRVEAVGIRAVRRGVDADVQEAQILREIRLQIPRRRILERHALHGHVLAVIEEEHPRPPRPAPHLAVLPPVALVALPVQHTFAVQHNILDVHPADKRGVHVQRVALPRAEIQIVRFVGGQNHPRQNREFAAIGFQQQRRAAPKLDAHMAFQHQRQHMITPRRNQHAPIRRAMQNRRLNRRRIVMHAIADRAELPDIERVAFPRCAERALPDFLRPPADGQHILCLRLQIIQ